MVDDDEVLMSSKSSFSWSENELALELASDTEWEESSENSKTESNSLDMSSRQLELE